MLIFSYAIIGIILGISRIAYFVKKEEELLSLPAGDVDDFEQERVFKIVHFLFITAFLTIVLYMMVATAINKRLG